MRHIQNGLETPANYRAYAVSREDVLLPDKDWPLPCSITPMFQERDGIFEKHIARFSENDYFEF